MPVPPSQLGAKSRSPLHSSKGKGYFITEMLFSPTKCDVSVLCGEKYPKNTNATSTSVPCSLPFTVHVEKSPRNICRCAHPARSLTAPETMPTPIMEGLRTWKIIHFRESSS